MENFNQIQLVESSRKKEVIFLSKAPSQGYMIFGMHVHIGYVVDVGDSILTLDTSPLIHLKSHCRGVVIMTKNSGDMVKEGDTLIEIEVGLDEEYLSDISKTLFFEDFEKRLSIVCQHDDFDDFDTISIKILNESSKITLRGEHESYATPYVDIYFTFIGTKFYLNLEIKYAKIDDMYGISKKNEAVIIFEDNIRERYNMNFKEHNSYGSYFYVCELSYNDMITFATKSFIKAKIAGVPVSFPDKKYSHRTIEMGQLVLKFMVASILKYVIEKYPDKYANRLVHKAQAIYEMYQTDKFLENK